MSGSRRGEQRRTTQQAAVRAALEEADGFISAQELHQRINHDGTAAGLATVYRQLNTLADSGYADTIQVPGGQLFRACAPGGHHHHLVCEDCGKAVEIVPPDEEWIDHAAADNGFTVTRHIVEVFGRCAECS
ncbi:MAG: Fur family transcriptional regulator [Arachnia sp.]